MTTKANRAVVYLGEPIRSGYASTSPAWPAWGTSGGSGRTPGLAVDGDQVASPTPRRLPRPSLTSPPRSRWTASPNSVARSSGCGPCCGRGSLSAATWPDRTQDRLPVAGEV